MKCNAAMFKQTGLVKLAIIAVFAFISVISPLFSPVNAQTTTVNYNPTADTYVASDRPTTNFGTATILAIDGSPIELAYMKFNLSTLAGKTINSAYLRLKIVNGGSQATQIYKIADTTSWSETGMTYNNRPTASTTITSTTGGPDATWMQANVLSAVNAKKGGTLAIRIETSTNTDGLDVKSRETTEKPTLVVTYSSAPTATPTRAPTPTPTRIPTATPTRLPTATPTRIPTATPTRIPTATPTRLPTATPTRIPTAIPTATSIPTAIPTPTGGAFGGLTIGQLVTGYVYVTYYSDQNLTEFVRFYIDDKFINDEYTYPYSLGGDTNGVLNGFDTTQLSNGPHTLKSEIHYKNGTVQTYSVTFSVTNIIQITPICIYPVPCTTNSTDPLCIPGIEPFGGWCPMPSATLIPTKVPTVAGSPTLTPTIVITTIQCPLNPQGDANCDNNVDMIDFEIWRQEFIGQVTTLHADFNNNGQTDLVDYETWRQGFVARLLP